MLSENLKRIFIIAKYTFTEIVRSKILYNTLFLGLGLFLMTFVAYSFTYGEPSRVALDFGLGTLTLSSIGISVFIGVGILSKEIESRTVYMIISRPVPRYAFIIGKYLGLSAVLLLNIFILSILTLSMFFIIGGDYNNLIHWSLLFTVFESLIVLLVVGTLSLVTSPTMSVLYTLVIYILGHSVTVAMQTSFVQNRGALKSFLEVYNYILPAFHRLNIKDFVLYKNDLSTKFLLENTLYAVMYMILLTLISIWIFQRKNLD